MSGSAKKSRKGVPSAKAGSGEHWEGTRVLRNTPIALAFGKLTPQVQKGLIEMLFPKKSKKTKTNNVPCTAGTIVSSRRANRRNEPKRGKPTKKKAVAKRRKECSACLDRGHLLVNLAKTVSKLRAELSQATKRADDLVKSRDQATHSLWVAQGNIATLERDRQFYDTNTGNLLAKVVEYEKKINDLEVQRRKASSQIVRMGPTALPPSYLSLYGVDVESAN